MRSQKHELVLMRQRTRGNVYINPTLSREWEHASKKIRLSLANIPRPRSGVASDTDMWDRRRASGMLSRISKSVMRQHTVIIDAATQKTALAPNLESMNPPRAGPTINPNPKAAPVSPLL